ncbi:MAG: hypothetical protein ACO3CJ_10030, partial [Burkholderiaceae bacterium]
QLSWLGSSQLAALYASPLVLDMNGNGIQTQSIGKGVRFDLDADGRPEAAGWVAGGDGLLVRDLNADGVINSGAELFGSATRLPDGTVAKDGFEALAALDSNADGKVDAGDAGFGSLKVWVDSDADGQTDQGELKGLSELGISSISVQAKATSSFNEGNWIGLEASFERSDGSQGEVADVWFRVSRSEALDEKAASLGDALKGYVSGEGSERPVATEAKASAPIRSEPLLAPPVAVQELSELLRHYRVSQALGAEPHAARLSHTKDLTTVTKTTPDHSFPLSQS